MRHSFIKSYIYTSANFVSRLLPKEILGYSDVAPYKRNAKFSFAQTPVEIIVFLVGESLSAEYMGVFGYEKQNTKFLQTQVNLPNVVLKKSFSAGLYTDASVPFLLHAIQKPNAQAQIFSNKTNLFRLAQDANFTTHFITAQSRDSSSYTAYFKAFVKDYQDPYDKTKNIYKGLEDDFLVDVLQGLDLSTKHFIVLNQIGSHEPYEKRSPANKKPFGTKTLLDEYLNSVVFTDAIIKKILEILEQSGKKFVFIATSDHGQHVTATSGGKGSFAHLSNYLVPLFIKVNKDLKPSLDKFSQNSSCKISPAVNISEFIAQNMGYDMAYSDCNTSFVANNNLSGDNGYLKIKSTKAGLKKEMLFK